ncbi:MAG: hypothetical protein ACYDCD_12505 [Candidatus Acidiferrales bacterium]
MAPNPVAKPQNTHRRTQRTASLALHQRKCIICHHPDREEMEEMFLHWFSPATIHRRFLLRDRYSIYRHAHATGLYQRRRRNLRCALENIIERSDECPISSNGIVRAIKAYASLTDAGEWIEPPSRIIYTNSASTAAPNAIASHATGSLTSAPQATTSTVPVDAQSTPTPTALPASQFTTTASIDSDRSAGVSPALLADSSAPVYRACPDAESEERRASDHSHLGHSSLPSNRNTARIKFPPTHSKQRSDTNSNRNK